jgi:hypothetical protein
MNIDRDDPPGQVPLAGFAAQRSGDAAASRRDGIRHARRMSNWTLAALITGTGAATVALVHQAAPTAVSPASTARTTTGQQAGSTAGGPTVSHPVATTTGSGATVTTTTRTVRGQTVIVRTVHAPRDN